MSRVLELAEFSGGHQGMKVVRDLSLHVDAGEVVCLLGPNGAGKTTTLLSVSGLLPVLGGHIRVLGKSVSRLRPHQIARRGVAHVPDDRGLIHSMTVAENLRLVGGARATAPVYERFPALQPLSRRRCGLLSGGEQQMLAVGRALVSRPKLLIIDEMSLGLAPVVVKRLLPAIRDIAKQDNVAVLLVEQHVELALSVSDRAYVLVHGELVREGPAATLRAEMPTIEASYLGKRASHEEAAASAAQASAGDKSNFDPSE